LTPSGSYAASPLLISGQTAGTVMSIEFNSGTLGTVKLESGANVTPFIMRPFDQELLACMRYYQKSYNYATIPGTASTSTGVVSGNANSTGQITPSGLFKVRMRGIPQMTLYSVAGTAGAWTIAGGSTDTAAATVSVGTLGENGFAFVNSSGLTAGSAYVGHYVADARL
jgi:hypothetical protein